MAHASSTPPAGGGAAPGTSAPSQSQSLALIRALRIHGARPPAERLRTVFDAYDTDGSGELDVPELERLVHDMVRISIEHAHETGASDAYVARAHDALDSERGRGYVTRAAQALRDARDAGRSGGLTFAEFSSELHTEEQALQHKGRFWHLAPLCDVEVVDVDELAQPHLKAKLFVAGSVAGVAAKTAGSPLARLTILLQTQSSRQGGGQGTKGGGAYTGTSMQVARQILKREGLRGFFRGNGADVLRAIPYTGVSYLSYEWYKAKLLEFDTSDSGVKARMGAGALSGITGVLLTYPIDLCRTRIAVQTTTQGAEYTGVAQALRKISRAEGPAALYRGCGVACAQIAPNLAVNFALFETLRNEFKQRGYAGVIPSLGSGIAAGIVANTLAFPLDVAMRNVQLGQYRSAVECMRALLRERGVLGLYRGLGPQLAKSVPVASVSFAAYDKMRQVLEVEVR